MDKNKFIVALSILMCVGAANAQSSTTTTTTTPTETTTTVPVEETTTISTPRDSSVPVESTTESTTTTAPATTTTGTTTVIETTDTTAERPDEPGGFFFEPLLTYTDTDADLETSDLAGFDGDTSADTDGAGLGVRLGSHIGETFLIGVDGRYSRLEISESGYGSADGDAVDVGPFVGLQMPTFAGLRIWGTYVMAGQFDPETGNQGVNLRFEEPQGWRYGVGFKIGTVSLNLEYQDLSFEETDIQSFGSLPGTAATDADFDIEGYTASLSFPMEF